MNRVLMISCFLLFLAFQGLGQVSASGQQENVVKLYPNPAVSTVQIQIENKTIDNPVISLHTLIGNKIAVKVESLENGTYKMDIADLPSGYYFIAIKDKDFNRTYKFLKN